MNTIIPYKNKQRIYRFTIAIVILLVVGILTYSKFALASNQSPTETIGQYNDKITVIENRLMVRSQSHNENDAIISSKQQENAKLEKDNQADREEKAKLTAEKEAKLLGK